MLSKPAPLLPVLDKVYRGAMDAILPRNLSLPARVSKDAQDRLLVENGLPIVLTFAAKTSVSSFRNSISLVFRSGAKPKMLWIDAKWRIAGMTNFNVFRYFSFVDGVEVSAGYCGSGPFGNNAITAPVCGACPKPTSGFFIYDVARQWVYSVFHPDTLSTCGSHLNRRSK